MMRHRSSSLAVISGAIALCALALAIIGTGTRAEEARVISPPALDEPAAGRSETAVFAGGCFWGVQGVFQHVKGVTNATSGYAGGNGDDAHYQTVGTGTTGHAESVQVTFDPSKISYGKLLQIYFSVAHDPTQLNRQGPDQGTQYRSTIFPTSAEQAKVAWAYIKQLDAAQAFPEKIVTTVEEGKSFFPAENYHQNFLTLNPTYPYIVINDLPKVENLRKLFADNFRDAPILVAVAKPSE